MKINAYVKVTLRGNNIRRFINLCTISHIKLWDIHFISEETFEICCNGKDIWKMKPYLHKTHTMLSISERKGYFKLMLYLTKTRILWGTIGIVIAMAMTLSMRIWNIHVSGNVSLSEVTIIDYVNKNSSLYGSISQKNYVSLEKSIEKKFSDVVWCNIYVDGTTLMIEISEGTTYYK